MREGAKNLTNPIKKENNMVCLDLKKVNDEIIDTSAFSRYAITPEQHSHKILLHTC